MGMVKQQVIEDKIDKQWHYQNCTIEYESDGDETGARWTSAAWCDEHKVDVTECLPDAPEPDYEEES